MGKHEPARRRAIELQLKEMGISMMEPAIDAMAQAEDEESRKIEEDYKLLLRANFILNKIASENITPNEWVANQPYTIETSLLHSILAEKWEQSNGPDTSFIR